MKELFIDVFILGRYDRGCYSDALRQMTIYAMISILPSVIHTFKEVRYFKFKVLIKINNIITPIIFQIERSCIDFMSSDLSFKLLMLGDASVGKTSLTHKYITGVFVDSPRLTIGVDFFSKKIRLENGKKVKLQIWDFGGEERFRFLLPTYSKNSNAALFLYDITSRKSLQSLPDWLEIVKKNAGDIPVLLIGSKLDLEAYREVSVEEAREAARKYRLAGHIEVSAKTGKNVEESFKFITKLLVENSEKLQSQEQYAENGA